MADLAVFSIGGEPYNLKDAAARTTANAATTNEEYDRQAGIGKYAGRSLAASFASEISARRTYTHGFNPASRRGTSRVFESATTWTCPCLRARTCRRKRCATA